MSKDYKHRLQQAQKQSENPAVAGWQWLLAGALVLGFVGFLLSLRVRAPPDPAPVATAVTRFTSASTEAKKSAQSVATAPTQAQAQVQKEPPPKESPLPKPPKPRFQFYTVLPEKEVIIPEAEVKARKQAEKQGKVPVGGDIYMLQIGSFKTTGEADRLKAQLAMLGVEAKIEVAQIANATWYRVKVGPFASIASADKTRTLLRQSNMDSVVQKSATPVSAQASQQTVAPPAP